MFFGLFVEIVAVACATKDGAVIIAGAAIAVEAEIAATAVAATVATIVATATALFICKITNSPHLKRCKPKLVAIYGLQVK
jgi:uncharacterized protein HemY